MAKRIAIPSKEVELVLVGSTDSFKASRVQRASLGTDIPTTVVDELGNSEHVGNTKDIPNVTLAFSAFDVGVKIFSALTGTDAAAYPGAGVDISELGEIDGIILVKDADSAVYAKSAHAHRLQIRDFTFNYSVDGESTEDYTAIGSVRRWLKYDVVVDKLLIPGTTGTLTQIPVQLANGDYVLSVIADNATSGGKGVYLTEHAWDDGSAIATDEYKLSGGTFQTITLGTAYVTQCIVVYHSDADGAWTDVSDTVSAVAIRGKDVGVKILGNDIDRVQSVSINGNLNTQPVKEMGNKSIVGYQKQVPTVEGTLTVLDTDTELIELLTYGVVASGVEWQPGEGCTTTDLSLTIELYDPCDVTPEYDVLKTIYLPDIVIVGDSYTANINNNAQQVFNFRSDDGCLIVYSG